MTQTRYRESRILARRLCRLPGQDKAEFRARVRRLRKHFQQFNVDTSELCQWIMGLRKRWVASFPQDAQQHPESFGPLGDFMLEPRIDGVDADEKLRDTWRLVVFDDLAGFRSATTLAGQPLPPTLRTAIDDASKVPSHPAGNLLFLRLRELLPQHRLVLLKSAAEWIIAHYQRGVENWVRQRAEWEKERAAWEKQHPLLSDEIQRRYTDVFKSINEDEHASRPGLRRKNPRICSWERLKQNIDNCCYAGQLGHAPLCKRYSDFIKAHKQTDQKFNDKTFSENANMFASLCRKYSISKAGFAFQSQKFIDEFYNEVQRLKASSHKNRNTLSKTGKPIDKNRAKADFLTIFKKNWNAYLKHMQLNDTTAIEMGAMPHCAKKIGNETFEKSKCNWNKHTDLCLRYKRLIGQFDAETLALEPQYREWRKFYLSGPRKPAFKYPSSDALPMPKVFGSGFYEVDFQQSILRVRLDDMREREWLEFGFTPWPRDYSPSRSDIAKIVTSVHIHFIGSRPRVGFRFEVPHRQSVFSCSQDDLDLLRSRTYPRRAQDQQFIDAARALLLESFQGNAASDLRVLAVDTGMTGAHVALFHGQNFCHSASLPIIKINRLYDEVPPTLQRGPRDRKMRGPVEFDRNTDTRGLRKEHLRRHFDSIAEDARTIAEVRQQRDSDIVTLEDHDFRSRKRHIAWMVRDWARHNAACIITQAEECKCHVIVFESLRGKRVPGYETLGDDNERKKAEGALYAYGRVRKKVTEQAVEHGMRVVTVPDYKSSQVCCACGKAQHNRGLWRKNKEKRTFICEHCKVKCNSDENAARVLARVFLGQITLPLPEDSHM